MAAQRSSFGKLQRDRAKQAKAMAKRERRQDRSAARAEESEADEVTASTGELSPRELLAQIERLHNEFESKEIDFEEFEERKADLLSRLPVD